MTKMKAITTAELSTDQKELLKKAAVVAEDLYTNMLHKILDAFSPFEFETALSSIIYDVMANAFSAMCVSNSLDVEEFVTIHKRAFDNNLRRAIAMKNEAKEKSLH